MRPPPADITTEFVCHLRRMSVSDTREAILGARLLLHGNVAGVDVYKALDIASLPSNGRLRHVLVKAIDNQSDFDRLYCTLLKWLDKENDEFTRRAILGSIEKWTATEMVAPI